MPEKLKLLFLNQTMGVGGAETLLNQLFAWLGTHAVEVQAYSTNSRAYPHAKRMPPVVDLIGDWKGLVKGMLLLPAAWVYYGYLVSTRRNADVLFVSGFIEKVLGSWWAKVWKIPVVWIEHGPYGRLMTQFGGLAHKLYSLVTGIPRFVIVPSRFTADWLASEFPEVKDRIVVIPNAIDRRTYSLTSNPNLVVCVSRLESGKGQDLLISAWPQVIRAVPQAKLRIVGEGDQTSNLKTQIANLRLTKSVALVGWVPDSRKEMAKAQVVAFPTLWPLEGFGMVAVEAASVGRPVVGFKFGPLPGVVDRSGGILVPAGDIRALAEAIVKLLKHPRTVKLKPKFTWAVAGQKYLQVFNQACASRISAI